jgi:hypothetical protein
MDTNLEQILLYKFNNNDAVHAMRGLQLTFVFATDFSLKMIQ